MYTTNDQKYQVYNRRAGEKLIFYYYNEHGGFSGSIDEYWQRHIARFNILCA